MFKQKQYIYILSIITVILLLGLFFGFVTSTKSLDKISQLRHRSVGILARSWKANDISHAYFPVVTNALVESTSKLILADQGGTIQLGSASLQIPPGALESDTTVFMKKPRNSSALYESGISPIVLEPDSLKFTKPAKLSVSNINWSDKEYINVATLNKETGDWVYLPGVTSSQNSSTASVPISHFSEYLWYSDKPMYIVMHLDPEYLKRGDILYAMTEKFGFNNWMTGHVGILAGESTVVESTQFLTLDNLECNPPGFGGIPGGVGESSFYRFSDGKTWGYYMGARRPPGATEVKGVVASIYATNQKGKGYSLTSLDSFGLGPKGPNCFSCVGLTEKSWDWAGIDIIENDKSPTPMQQFKKTDPVEFITAPAGQQISIKVNAIVKVDLPILPDHYKEQGLKVENIEGLPEGARFSDSNSTFTWIPLSKHVRQEPYKIIFKHYAKVGDKYVSKEQELNIKIVEESANTPTPTATSIPSSTETPTVTSTPSPTATNTPIPENDVTMELARTLDYDRNEQTSFQPGEVIVMSLMSINHTTSDLPVKYSWKVFDPNGKKVDILSYDNYSVSTPPGEFYRYWNAGISSNAKKGVYRFVAEVKYNGKTSVAQTTFSVQGSPVPMGLLWSVTAKDFESWNPIDITDTFLKSDEFVWSYTEWEGADIPHKALYKWYGPNGSLVGSVEFDVDLSYSYTYLWGRLCVRDCGMKAGNYKIKIFIDGELKKTQYFEIVAGQLNEHEGITNIAPGIIPVTGGVSGPSIVRENDTNGVQKYSGD